MFGRIREARTIGGVPWSSQAQPWGRWPNDPLTGTYYGGGGAAGVYVDSLNATQLLTVYSCVTLIADTVATLPIDVFSEEKDGSRTSLPTPSWMDEPIPGVDRIGWLTQILSSLLLDGNAYLAMHMTGGSIAYLQPLDPSTVDIRRENGARVVYANGQRAPWPVLHIPAVMRAGCDVGMSPIEAARQTIGSGMAVQEFAGRFFSQGATMAGVITVPGAMPPEGPASPKEMAKAFARQHSGKNRAHLPAVLQGGAQWQSTGVTNEQAQFLQTRQFTAAEIAGQLFHVDPTNLGIPVLGTSLVYGNLEQRKSHLLTFAMMPWIVRLETAFSALLVKPRYVKFNADAFLRADTQTRFNVYKVAIDSRLMSPDEIRRLEDLPPIPDGSGKEFYGPMAPGKPEPQNPAADAVTDTGTIV